jgi:hypothetical protein
LIDDVRVQREDGQWVGQVAADCVGVSRGLRIDVEVAPDGSRHMSHYDSTNRQLLYTTDESGSWVTTIIDDGGDGPGGLYAGEYHSLVLDSAGKAHIVYNRQGASYYNLWYATNAGGPWNTQQISTASGNEITVSLAIDQADKLHVGYRNTWTGPKYLSNAGGTWTGATPPGGGDATAVDIVVDSTGVVHMVWDNTSAAPDAVQYARRETTGAWSGEVVDGGTASRYPTLAVNGDGKVRVLYRREFQLGYAVRDVGGAWHKSTIGTEASEMPYDIAVSASGKVAIVYYNNTEAKLIEGYLDGVLSPASVRIPPPFE